MTVPEFHAMAVRLRLSSMVLSKNLKRLLKMKIWRWNASSSTSQVLLRMPRVHWTETKPSKSVMKSCRKSWERKVSDKPNSWLRETLTLLREKQLMRTIRCKSHFRQRWWEVMERIQMTFLRISPPLSGEKEQRRQSLTTIWQCRIKRWIEQERRVVNGRRWLLKTQMQNSISNLQLTISLKLVRNWNIPEWKRSILSKRELSSTFRGKNLKCLSAQRKTR